MTKEIDARGLACPQPVILTRKALAESSQVVTIVDSKTSRDNVRRMAEKANRTVTVDEREGLYYLRITGKVDLEPELEPKLVSSARDNGSPVVVVGDRIMGRGDQQLGEILVRGFFHTLGEVEPLPETIIFFNAGVWLAIDDSPILEDLQELSSQGITILACGTCLGHFGITDRLAVGQISNMYDIAETMLNAARLVAL